MKDKLKKVKEWARSDTGVVIIPLVIGLPILYYSPLSFGIYAISFLLGYYISFLHEYTVRCKNELSQEHLDLNLALIERNQLRQQLLDIYAKIDGVITAKETKH